MIEPLLQLPVKTEIHFHQSLLKKLMNKRKRRNLMTELKRRESKLKLNILTNHLNLLTVLDGLPLRLTRTMLMILYSKVLKMPTKKHRDSMMRHLKNTTQ
jgi:hypothetical protein